jgi:hypothetical protein
MQKTLKNKELKSDSPSLKNKQAFFFPKEKPPVSIEAESLEEAEKKLAKLRNK